MGARLGGALAHRGPDGEGCQTLLVGDQHVTLVHRRLAILDLTSAAAQPMHDADTGNWVTFNGEIYNYRALKRDLENRGYVFKTHSDTEVLLKAYAEFGDACVHRLRGMFAFAIWDARRRRAFCAVDRFSIKPFYYTHRDGTFTFASEVRALLHAGVVPRAIDEYACVSFFSYGSVQAPRTIVQHVLALLPAQTLVLDADTNTVTIDTYWTPQAGKETAYEDVNTALNASVTEHLVSDVPLGLFLSGGVDSSALAVLTHRTQAADLHAFNISFDERAYSEGAYARQIGERFCSSYTEIVLSASEVSAMLSDTLKAMDQPTIDGVNAYAISKAVRARGIKAVLSGQGGDEVFGGYPNFSRLPKWAGVATLHRHVPSKARALYAPLVARMAPIGAARDKVAQLVAQRHSMDSLYALSRQLFTPDAIADSLPNAPCTMTLIDERADASSFFNAVSLMEMRGYLANTLLRDGDVMSMAHGLEVRVPFLDHRLVETVWSLPEHAKMHATLPKPALLQAVKDDLPPELYLRKKMGFTFPWDMWLRNELAEELHSTVDDTPSAEAIGLSLHTTRKLYSDFLSGTHGITWSRVWAPYVLLRWVRENVLV